MWTRKDPPPVYVSTAFENGIWFCAVGSQAEGAVRTALACMRGATELSIFGLGVRGLDGKEPSRASPGRDLAGNHVAAALITAEGMRAVYDCGFVLGRGSESAFWSLLRQRTGLRRGHLHPGRPGQGPRHPPLPEVIITLSGVRNGWWPHDLCAPRAAALPH